MADQVLVVGASGLVGHYSLMLWQTRGVPVVGTYLRHQRSGCVQLDVTDASQVEAIFRHVRPTVVLNASNMAGGTDTCERDPQRAQLIHFTGARNLADACSRYHARFVQVSTDYVFDGLNGPYREDDPPNPISEYGRAKLAAERYVLESLSDSLVIRTTFVFDWDPYSSTKNFVMTLLDRLNRGESVEVALDQFGNPTLATNLANALIEATSQRITGILNVAGSSRCSRLEWAMAAAMRLGLDARLLRGVRTAVLNQIAKRPLKAGFILDRAAALLSTRLLTLAEALDVMCENMSEARRA
jgi:dTDP-4-dehydrorhamnose reductase